MFAFRLDKKNAQQMLSVCFAVIQQADEPLCTKRSWAFAPAVLRPLGAAGSHLAKYEGLDFHSSGE